MVNQRMEKPWKKHKTMKTIQKHENQKSRKHRQRWLSPNNRISSEMPSNLNLPISSFSGKAQNDEIDKYKIAR